MFSIPSNSGLDPIYENGENASKWKKIFTSALQKVLKQVHPNLSAQEEALEYAESLLLRLLAMLCAYPYPHTVQDIEDRVIRIFPHPIDKWAVGDAQAALEKGKKKTHLVLPVEKVHNMLRDALQTKVDYQVSFYVVAVLEYISADILKLVGNYVLNIKRYEVTHQDIRIAMCADKVLMDMFHEDNDNEEPLLAPLCDDSASMVDSSLTYDEIVKDLMVEERGYIRELHMIIKVFKNKLDLIPSLQSPHRRKSLDIIFSNIHEVQEFSINLLGSIEDTVEGTKEDDPPAVGTCFEEFAEVAEFDVYLKYGTDILTTECLDTLSVVVSWCDVSNALTTAGHGFKEAVKYCLPRLLLLPIIHVFKYFKYIELLSSMAPNEEIRESLEQVTGLLFPLQSQLDRAMQASPYNNYIRKQISEFTLGQYRRSKLASLQKLQEVQKSIDGWEGRDLTNICSDFIYDGNLKVGFPGKKQSDRHVFLFNNLIVSCKLKMGEYKYKEKITIVKLEVVDKEDNDELRNAFEIRSSGQLPMIFSAKSPEDKNNWMAAVITLNTRGMLERTLDSILLDQEKQHPLRPPDPLVYPFSEEEHDRNICFDEKPTGGTPMIRGANLFKLIERLTYHMYADPMFVRTFLTTYRSFCTPVELLNLLNQRFDIPEPEPPDISENDPPEMRTQKLAMHRECCKRFRREYSQPVQFRVLNVLRHWVDYHFYDFERDKQLLEKLLAFLDRVKAKSMRKWVNSITKIIQRKCNEEPREITFSHNKSPPSPKVHLAMDYEDWEISLPRNVNNVFEQGDFVRPLLMLHPIEIARQLSLYDFDLFRAIKPSELVGTPWMKADKDKNSPNLLRMIHHANNVSNWLQRCVVECQNFDERIAVMNRIIEILIVLYDLNNFCGTFQFSSALESASVHRLELTKAEVRKRMQPHVLKAYEDILSIHKNHYKSYVERLRSINPPCVPFFGIYLSNILHIEDGNADCLSGKHEGLINFNKRRKVAEITGEIQTYQNQPYCLEVEPHIRNFLENLRPFENVREHEISNFLYAKSKEIEPKNCRKAAVKERRWPNLSLKSPGIKLRSSRSVPNPLPSMFGSVHKAIDGGGEGEETPHHLTPPTPSTPGTPPPSANPDKSIFAPVEIGHGVIAGVRHSISGVSTSSMSFHAHGTASVPPTPISTIPPLPLPPHTPLTGSSNPPPLPPRNHQVAIDTSPKVKQAPDAPKLPPRDASAPPIPPRVTTLPRMHTSSSLANLPTSFHQPPPYPLGPYPPFTGLPPNRQYRLDPPPQRRRTSSMDLSSPAACNQGPLNGIQPVMAPPTISELSLVDLNLNDTPPPPPPRLSRPAFTYDPNI